MNFLDVALRHSMPRGKKYPAYVFEGPWTETEKSMFKDLGVDQYIPELEEATYNNWRFSKLSNNHFIASRATWEFGVISGKSSIEIFTQVVDYYTR